MPQRAMTNSRSPSLPRRTIGAIWSGKTPGNSGRLPARSRFTLNNTQDAAPFRLSWALEMRRLEPAAPSRPEDLFKFDPSREGSKRHRQNTSGQNQTLGARLNGGSAQSAFIPRQCGEQAKIPYRALKVQESHNPKCGSLV
jgi:hypothetical protein